MFSNIDENKLFCHNALTYYVDQHMSASSYQPNGNGNHYYTVIKNELRRNNNNTISKMIDSGKIQMLIFEIKKRISDIKFRYTFIPSVKNMTMAYQEGGSNNTLIINDTLKIFTNYNFIITIHTTFYNNKDKHMFIPAGWDYNSHERYRKLRECVEFEIKYFTNTTCINLPNMMFDINNKIFNWPEFPIEKRILPAVYFDYLLENNQNCEFEHAIATTQTDKAALEATLTIIQAEKAALEATLITTQTEKASLEATVNEQARRIADLMTDLNTQDNMLIDLKAKYELLKIDYDNTKSQLTNEMAKYQVSTDNIPLLNVRKKRCVIM